MRVRWLVGLVLLGVVGALVAATTLGELPTGQFWALVATALLGLLPTVFSDLVSNVWGNVLRGRGDRRGLLARTCLTDDRRRLPKVRDTDRALLLGLPRGPVPPYVPRDVDDRLDEAVRDGGVVVLAGPPGAGKSRAGFEALRRTHPTRVLLAPRNGAALAAIVEAGLPLRRSLLWLDDLDRFFADGACDRFLVHRMLRPSVRPALVLGTRTDADRDAPARSVADPVGHLVEDAVVLEVPGVWSPAERERARALGLGALIPQPRHPPLPVVAPAPPRVAAPGLPSAPLCLGRETYVAEVVAAACAPVPAPLWLLGPPGVGKSTILRTALHDDRVVQRFGVRRHFVRCDSSRLADALVADIAVSLGVPVGPGLLDTVVAELAGAPALLALDGADVPWEHDPTAVEELLERLAGIPGVAVVGTIRGSASPGIRGARRLPVRPLDLATARELFLAVAGAEYTTDRRLGELLAAQDGLPIAVRLLAVAAQGEPNLEAMWRRWTAQRSLIDDGLPGRDGLDLSVDLTINSPRMNAASHRLLSTLGVLPDGLDLDDLARLMPDTGDAAAATLRKVGLAYDEQGRLRTLAPIREYVARNRPPDAEVRAALVSHYAGLAVDLGLRVGGERGASATARLVTESGNLDAVLRDALRDDDPTRAIQAVCALGEFTRWSGIGGTELLELAAAAANRVSAVALQAECLYRLGDLALRRCEHDAATDLLARALPLFEAARDVLWQAHTIKHIGDTAFEMSRYDEAVAHFDRAEVLYQQVGDARGQARCIKCRGDVAERRSDYTAAAEQFERALGIAVAIPDEQERADCLRRLADVELALGDLDSAERRYRAAADFYRGTGAVLGRANCVRGLGQVALARGDFEATRDAIQRAEPLYQRMRYSRGQAECIAVLGRLALAQGERDSAAELFRVALSMYEPANDTIGASSALLGLAAASASGTDPVEVVELAGRALAGFERVGRFDGIAEARVLLADATADPAGRAEHVAAARAAWLAVGRQDRVAALDERFGPLRPARGETA